MGIDHGRNCHLCTFARIRNSGEGRPARMGKDIAYHLFTVDLLIYRLAARVKRAEF